MGLLTGMIATGDPTGAQNASDVRLAGVVTLSLSV